MKKILGFLLLLLCMSPLLAMAGEADVTWKQGSKTIDAALLSDGSDETEFPIARAKSVELTATLEDGESVRSLYLRMDSFAAKIEWQMLGAKKKWETVASIDGPTAECILTSDVPVTGRIRLRLTYPASTATPLKELRLFSEEVPAEIRAWQRMQEVDVLLTLDDLSALDLQQLRSLTEAGHSVAVAALQTPDAPLEALDALWDAGVRAAPSFGGYTKPGKTPEKTLSAWKQTKVTATVTSWLRVAKPLLAVDGGDVTALVMETAAENALSPFYEVDDAAANGIWAAPVTQRLTEDLSPALSALPERTPQLLRDACLTLFAGAEHGDTASIPYPDTRDAQGYLPEGEFLHEDKAKGLWAYLSSTLQVEILRYEQDTRPQQVYFVADVQFKPEQEQLRQHTWVNASFKNQGIYPQTLAQSGKLVVGINGDYYLSRVNKKITVGNELRAGEVLYNMNMNKDPLWPILDTMALHDDGSMSVYGVKEITADELQRRGDVHDALSFGPYLVRDGALRIYNGKHNDEREPRTAIGMIAPGHYIFLVCEGRIEKDASGMTVNEAAMLLYGLGCEQAFMLDGGNTSVLLFMGNQLNRNGGSGAPRNQHELFGVGSSELVHTEWAEGKP